MFSREPEKDRDLRLTNDRYHGTPPPECGEVIAITATLTTLLFASVFVIQILQWVLA